MGHFRRSMADRPPLTPPCTGLADFRSTLQEQKPAHNHMGKAVFSRMAEEEMGHFRYLRRQYRFILETGDYDFTRKLLKSPKKGASSPIFSKEIKKRIKSSHFEVSALSIGMKLEMEAAGFYRKCAAKATTPSAKKFYNELAEWEQGHYQSFKNQLDLLKEEYFAANHFVPM
jgi:rubrerythrin